MKKNPEYYFINNSSSILEALKQMDISEKKLLIVVEEKKYKGLISIGDIQRALIANYKLTDCISEIMRNDYIVVEPDFDINIVKGIMLNLRAEFMPVVDNLGVISDILLWEELFGNLNILPVGEFNVPVVVMAGGEGRRLRPLTNVLPKPLIPIGDKTIIEEIFERFHKYGCDHFYISTNYKADLIEYYLLHQDLSYTLTFFREKFPSGTAGSLSMLKGLINDTFFVSNCDILIDQDFSEVLKYHKSNNNELTMISVLKNYPIAYGTLESGNNGQLLQINEKPELTFQINTGMYILEPHLLNEIPENDFFHITQLIEKIVQRGGKVGVFPVSERSWYDIGNWDEYIKVINV